MTSKANLEKSRLQNTNRKRKGERRSTTAERGKEGQRKREKIMIFFT